MFDFHPRFQALIFDLLQLLFQLISKDFGVSNFVFVFLQIFESVDCRAFLSLLFTLLHFSFSVSSLVCCVFRVGVHALLGLIPARLLWFIFTRFSD